MKLKKYWIEIAITFVLIFSAVAIFFTIEKYYSVFGYYWNVKSQQNWGVFGDYVGGILGPFFSFISFILLIGIFLYQKKEAKELQFENLFFNMVQLHHEIVKALSVDGKNGKNCFEVYKQRLERELFENLTEVDVIKSFRTCYHFFFNSTEGNKADLGHYFRNLIQILRIIDEKEIEDKKTYIRIIRAQLSDPELAMLYYNSLSCYGHKWIKYINNYDFLDNLDVHSINEGCRFFLTKDKKIKGELIPDTDTDKFCKMKEN